MAQGITDRIKALRLQKDGLMSVAARRKKAFAQLEESEKTLESKRKALQQAQEALEEASRKHAAAQEACASVEHEIEEEEDQDEEMHAIGVLDRSHRCISHVQLVRATRHCLENARNKWRVNFKHTKAHQGQWQNKLADSLAKMGSYSFPSESTLPLSMARWYQNSQTPAQTIPVTDPNPMSVAFWLQVACLPDPQNVVERSRTRASHNNDGESGGKIKMRKWKVVTASVLCSLPVAEDCSLRNVLPT